MMLRVRIPVEQGNRAIKDGTLQQTFEATMAALKPEAAYFLAEDGERAALYFFDMDDPSRIPSIAEPLFMNLNARLELVPVMDASALQTGLQSLA